MFLISGVLIFFIDSYPINVLTLVVSVSRNPRQIPLPTATLPQHGTSLYLHCFQSSAHSFAVFCATLKSNSFLFKQLRTL